MKKILLSVAVLATLASCSQNEVVDLPQSNEIGFRTLNDRVVSKNANDNETPVDFRVFAQKVGSEAWSFVDYVTDGATTATAPAGGPYYWPTDGSTMKFYGYAPYEDGNTVTESAATAGTVNLAYIVPAGAQEDFTVATPVESIPDAETKEYADTNVAFTFNHMLSKVSVKVELEDEFGDKNFISVNEKTEPNPATAYNDNDAEFTATFTALKNAIAVDATASDPAPAAATVDANTSLAYSGVQSYYIAPQAFKDCKLQINGITIRDNATKSVMLSGDLKELTLTGAEIEGKTDVEFEAGVHYIFTITISGESIDAPEITFTANTAEWGADVNVGVNQTK